MPDKNIVDKEFIRLGRYLNEVTTITDSTGKVLHQLVKPVMTEFYLRDVIQVIVGATLLSIPVAFTEEVWRLGETMPWRNIFYLVLVSISFISVFVYYNYYMGHFRKNIFNFAKRVISTYLLSLIIVTALMAIIAQVDLAAFFGVSLKRIIIVAFPASMSAVVADSIK